MGPFMILKSVMVVQGDVVKTCRKKAFELTK